MSFSTNHVEKCVTKVELDAKLKKQKVEPSTDQGPGTV